MTQKAAFLKLVLQEICKRVYNRYRNINLKRVRVSQVSEDKRNFFISYNKADKQWAKWIAAILEENGYSTYIQAWDFRPGENFVIDMHYALLNSERFIAVMSNDYLNSMYCQAEWASAFSKDPNGQKRLFIPVRIADVNPEGLLPCNIYIDLFGIDEDAAKKRLLNGVDTKKIPRNRPSYPGTPKVRFPGSLPFHNLSYNRNIYFAGRNQILEDIYTTFKNGSIISLAQVITGLGGVGKTQIALEYAYRYAPEYDLIWWVPSETDESILAAYQEFAERLGLLNKEQSNRDLVIEYVLNWMDTHSKWLFIYDNVDKLPTSAWWMPKNNRGNVLITTRYRYNYGTTIDISLFTSEEAISFLTKRTGLKEDKYTSLLAAQLGYLPLALEQAAAYIRNNECTYRDYLKLLNEYGLNLLEDVEENANYKQPVTIIWNISLDKINLPSARQLLNMCSFLASENIDVSLFARNKELLPLELQQDISDKLKFKKVWKELTRYSLLKRQDGDFYSMHRLLQKVVRAQVSEDSQWFLSVLSLLENTYAFSYKSQNDFLLYTPHVEALINAVVGKDLNDEILLKIAALCSEAGYGNHCLGNYPKALEWDQYALKIHIKVLGQDHPKTATSYSNLAVVYNSQGNYTRALKLNQNALKIHEKALGKEHLDTATTYKNIAGVYYMQENYDKALEWYQKTLEIREKVLGKNHPKTATTYNKIALVYNRQKNYTQALEWYKKALEIREKILGKNHPDTAGTYNDIAIVYDNIGDYQEALKWNQKALAINENVLGDKHPKTAITYYNIANVYINLHDFSNAQKWNEKALEIREKVLGKNHPDTAYTYKNIAKIYNLQGEYSKALEWYQKVLRIFEKRLGKNHPASINVKRSIENLSSVLYNSQSQ